MKSLIGFLRNNWALIVVIVLVAGMIPSAYKCGNDAMARKALAEKEKAATETKEIIEANNQKHYAEIDKLVKDYNKVISVKNEKVASLNKEYVEIKTLATKELKIKVSHIIDQQEAIFLLGSEIDKRDKKIVIQNDIIIELNLTLTRTEATFRLTLDRYKIIIDGKDKIISDLNDLFQDAKKLGSKRRIRIAPFAGWTPLNKDKFSAGIGIVY